MKSWNYKDFTVYQYKNLDSTNDEAFKMADVGRIGDCEIIMALEQNKGKGRLNRNWVSKKGNLYFSLVLRPKVDITRVPQISFVAVVALRLALEGLIEGCEICNKWPNDLLINGRKVAGLLLESKNGGGNCNFVVVGIGVNIASKPNLDDKNDANFRADAFAPACLQDFGLKITPEILLEKFLLEFSELYQNWLSFGFVGVRNLWLQKAWKLGGEISVNEGGGKIVGIFKNLDEEGGLEMLVGGVSKKINVGDVAMV